MDLSNSQSLLFYNCTNARERQRLRERDSERERERERERESSMTKKARRTEFLLPLSFWVA